MAKWNLNAPEESIATSWLFEQNGFLDFAKALLTGQTARQALAADPNLDITQWVRDVLQFDPVSSLECSMIWFMRSRDNVQIVVPPVETAAWILTLQAWRASIEAAIPTPDAIAQRDGTTVPISDETGTVVSTMGAGLNVVNQLSMFNKVLDVLTVL